MVMRETPRSSVLLTARDSMLKPRREKSPATRASTPGRFSTSAVIVCCTWVGSSRPLLYRRFGTHPQVVVRHAGGDHRVDVFLGGHPAVDHHRDIADPVALVQRVAHLLRTPDGDPDAAV